MNKTQSKNIFWFVIVLAAACAIPLAVPNDYIQQIVNMIGIYIILGFHSARQHFSE